MSTNWALKGLLAGAIAAAASTGFTAGQDSKVLNVSATIAGGCVLSLSGPMAFGNLNLTGNADETKDVTATYHCATGQSVLAGGFVVGGSTSGTFVGSMTALGSGNTDTIPYTIGWTQPGQYDGDGFASAGQSVTLHGLITHGNFITKKPDTYAQNVVVAINY